MSAARAIPMVNGFETLVSAQDFERVNEFTWHRTPKGYVQRNIRVNGKVTSVQLHRWLLDAQPGQIVDHANGLPLDNRRENLRICTRRENSTNVVHSKRKKLGGFKGVHWNKRAKKWQASICGGEVRANGKRKLVYLGLFTNPEDAARAYDLAAEKAFGAFASLNFPEEAELRMAMAEQSERAEVAAALRGDS